MSYLNFKSLCKSILFFILYALLLIAFQTFSSIVLMAVAASKGIRNEDIITQFANDNILISNAISFILVSLVLILIFKIRKAKIKKEFKLQKCKAKHLLMSIGLAFSYSFLFFLLTYDNNFENSETIHNSVDYYSRFAPGLGFVLMIINLLVLAPISEELSFRGIVYTRSESESSALMPVIVSSLLFGIMHLSVGGILLVIGGFVMGFVFSFIFYKTKSLYACIIAHSMANLPDFVFYNHPKISGIQTVVMLCISTAIMLVSFALLYRSE